MSKDWSLRPNATREERLGLQKLARHAMITRLMEDIRADMMVCVEGWDKMEYINEIKGEMDRFAEIYKKQIDGRRVKSD